MSRTGYTGEDGFEVFVPPAQAERVWDAIIQAGRSADLKPCGLGARDTLRLEACMRLCGSDMDDQTTVLEAGLGWIVGLEEGRLPRREGPARPEGGQSRHVSSWRSRCATARSRRHGYPVVRDGQAVGVVTSGTQTPFLKKAIGLAMVPVGHDRRRHPVRG